MTDVEKLRLVGEALFGSIWQTDLASALHVSDRTVRNWLSGKYPIPPNVWVELAAICRDHIGTLSDIAKVLDAAA